MQRGPRRQISDCCVMQDCEPLNVPAGAPDPKVRGFPSGEGYFMTMNDPFVTTSADCTR